MNLSDSRRASIAWLFLCFAWGTGFVAAREGVKYAPPFLFAGLRVLGAGLLLLVICLLTKAKLPNRRQLATLLTMGAVIEGFTNICIAFAVFYLTSGMLSLMLATTPFWMVGIEALKPQGDRLSSRHTVGLAIGFTGMVGLLAPKLIGVSYNSHLLMGCLVMQGACVSISFGSLYVRHQRLGVAPFMGAAWQMISAGVIVVLVGTLRGEWARWHFTPQVAKPFFYLLLIPSMLGYSCYVYCLPRIPLALFSLHRYINTVVTFLLGWLILGEKFGVGECLAVVVIFIGVFLVQNSSFTVSKKEPSS
ncbi:MAG: EamA family transporter [Armatimonadetes bacterium]|nr:EamA family transporter [Armatimonadota bacterium]